MFKGGVLGPFPRGEEGQWVLPFRLAEALHRGLLLAQVDVPPACGLEVLTSEELLPAPRSPHGGSSPSRNPFATSSVTPFNHGQEGCHSSLNLPQGTLQPR